MLIKLFVYVCCWYWYYYRWKTKHIRLLLQWQIVYRWTSRWSARPPFGNRFRIGFIWRSGSTSWIHTTILRWGTGQVLEIYMQILINILNMVSFSLGSPVLPSSAQHSYSPLDAIANALSPLLSLVYGIFLSQLKAIFGSWLPSRHVEVQRIGK